MTIFTDATKPDKGHRTRLSRCIIFTRTRVKGVPRCISSASKKVSSDDLRSSKKYPFEVHKKNAINAILVFGIGGRNRTAAVDNDNRVHVVSLSFTELDISTPISGQTHSTNRYRSQKQNQ